MTIRLSIRTKVTVAYTLVFGLMLCGFAFLVYRTIREAQRAELDAYLRTFAERLGAEVEEQYSEGAFPVISEFNAIGGEGLSRPHYLLRDLAGRTVIEDTLLEPMVGGAPIDTLPVYREIQRGEADWRVLSNPVEVNDRITFAVTVSSSLDGVEAQLAMLRLLFLAVIPAGLVLAALAASLIARAAFAPVTSMIATANDISAENLQARLELPVARDEIRLLGETLNSMMTRIQRAFEAQRQFIADASHEIRTPLTVIRSNLEFLHRKLRRAEPQAALRDTVAELDRLSRMAENLLVLSRLENPDAVRERTAVRLDELIVECVHAMDPLFKSKGVRLDVHIGEAVEMPADREAIKCAMVNLLDNGLKFTRRRGRVSARLERDTSGELPVHVSVQDTGCGIAPADLPHIFTRFFRSSATRGETAGSGLGLAIVDEIVRMHRGMVAVESTPGHGTIISLHFPG
ncbi:MAG TPA: HAMP domain-containing sensor histidine kinase [Bacteroidota bacterium]|nr:HAMP domain-containing sensor histidine kinase [Bacteroidota bacterium]